MARGRMISKTLSTSAKRDALFSTCPKIAEFCEFLFVMLVVHADDQGRLPGDEFTVKMQIDPVSRRKLPEFVAALHLLHEVGLIVWYQVDGKKLIQVVNFAEHQDLKGHNLRPGKLAPCPNVEAYIGRKPHTETVPEKHAIKPDVGEDSPNSPQTSLKLTELKLSESKLTQPNEGEGGRFDLFWAAYPKKKSKDAARKAFDRRAVSDDLLRLMLEAIETQKHTREWTKDGGQYIPHPATWLNAAGWEDEPVRVGPAMSEQTAMLVEATKGFLES